MSDVAALIADMIRAGVDPDLIGRIAATIASPTEQAAAPKTARQKRNSRYYQKKASERRLNVSEQDVSDDQDAVPPKKETSPAPPKEKTTPSSSRDRSLSHSVRAELETILDAERSKAVVDHRNRIGRPLTPHAARLLAGKFAKCSDANLAADEMISNGWQGFDPEWLQNRTAPQRQATAPPGRKRNYADVALDRWSIGNGSESVFCSDGDVEFIPPRRG